MYIHDSDKLQIIDEADNVKVLAITTDDGVTAVELGERDLEDLFDDLVDYFAKKAESFIDSKTLEEMSVQAEKSDNVLTLR